MGQYVLSTWERLCTFMCGFDAIVANGGILTECVLVATMSSFVGKVDPRCYEMLVPCNTYLARCKWVVRQDLAAILDLV